MATLQESLNEELMRSSTDPAVPEICRNHIDRFTERIIANLDHPSASNGNDLGSSDPGLRRSGKKKKRNRNLSKPPVWTEDDSVNECKNCIESFSFTNRRHHCRSCGQIFCNNCTSNRVPLPTLGLLTPERVCDKCFEVRIARGARSQ
eukprot:TRINITY_DN4103_c0_g1_i4.p1 TRINITY_DN4103_c0_g1~~TRINITY_DN4103_c0_g1_i4.p1  ORF type:complete len:148 (-),score=10.18 TRINITY_DN4103_c0_g1_i4:83-526(-)